MPTVKSNAIEIHYETKGDSQGVPLLLIMGLGSQWVRWPEKFLNEFITRGFRLILFDNRDVGKSTHFEDAGLPNLGRIMKDVAEGKKPDIAYDLDAMADDTAGLLTALGFERIHVFGISMGGMIAQTLAIRHPSMVSSLTSVMSTTGNPAVPPGKPEVMAQLMKTGPNDRDSVVERTLESDRLIGSQVFPFEEDIYRARAELAYDRNHDPAGVARQMAAITSHGNRCARLEKLEVPTLVIHGAEDPLVHIEGGRDTARCIPNAEFLEVAGMGHDLPSPVHAQIADAVKALIEG